MTSSFPSESETAPSSDPESTSTSSSGGIAPWQGAGILLVLAVVGLGLYGLWPVLTGQADDDTARDDVEAPSSEAEIDAVLAKRVDFPLRTQASGYLTPWREARLHAQAEGPVVERSVDEGDRVAEGDLIARLVNREERIALKEARAKLLKARAEYRAKYGGDQPALAAGDSADGSSVLDRSARQATQEAASGLTAARQAVERAELNLERTRVTAPFAGRVANLEVEEGQYASRGAEVATLLQDNRMKVEVDVLEGDLVHIDEGATAQVHVPAVGEDGDSTRIEGAVWAVNPQVERESGTGRVTVSIPNPERRLVSGLYAEVQLETRRLQDRLVVPEDAVLVRQGRDLVFVVEGGRAQWTYVDLGARSGTFVEITDGVAAGDTIAVDGHFALAHDAPVNVDEVRTLEVE
jgi:RND family efflux transporter MFP subunit